MKQYCVNTSFDHQCSQVPYLSLAMNLMAHHLTSAAISGGNTYIQQWHGLDCCKVQPNHPPLTDQHPEFLSQNILPVLGTAQSYIGVIN